MKGDFNNDGAVNFADFIAFAGAFGTESPIYDLDGSGLVDFQDFLIFATLFRPPVISRFGNGPAWKPSEAVLKFLVSPERERKSGGQDGRIRPYLMLRVDLTNADRRFCSRAKTAGDFKTSS